MDWINYLLDRSYLGAVRPAEAMAVHLAEYGRWLVATFGAPGVTAGVVGTVALVRRRPLDSACLLAALLLLAFLSASYHVPRQHVFYLPSFVVFALAVALGLTAAADAVGRHLPGRPGLAAIALACLAISAPIARDAAPRYRQLWHDHRDGGCGRTVGRCPRLAACSSLWYNAPVWSIVAVATAQRCEEIRLWNF